MTCRVYVTWCIVEFLWGDVLTLKGSRCRRINKA